MGFFSDLFGSTDESAQGAQIASNRASLELTERLADRARSDVISLFGPAQEARQQGFGAALDIFGESIPAQIGAIQTGTQNARATNLAGLEQIQNAILGRDVDFSQLTAGQRPQAGPPNLSGLSLPDFRFSGAGATGEAGGLSPIENLLGGGGVDPGVDLGPVGLQGLTPHKDHFHDEAGTKILATQLPGIDTTGLTPHKGHFHRADGSKVSPSEILSGNLLSGNQGQTALSALGGGAGGFDLENRNRRIF